MTYPGPWIQPAVTTATFDATTVDVVRSEGNSDAAAASLPSLLVQATPHWREGAALVGYRWDISVGRYDYQQLRQQVGGWGLAQLQTAPALPHGAVSVEYDTTSASTAVSAVTAHVDVTPGTVSATADLLTSSIRAAVGFDIWQSRATLSDPATMATDAPVQQRAYSAGAGTLVFPSLDLALFPWDPVSQGAGGVWVLGYVDRNAENILASSPDATMTSPVYVYWDMLVHTVITFTPLRYRWIYDRPIPLRQYPRDDYLGGAPRQGHRNGPTSVQASARQAWRGTYR